MDKKDEERKKKQPIMNRDKERMEFNEKRK